MQLHRERERIRAAGAELWLVGNGSPTFARAFVEDFGIEAPLLVDPSRRTYRALGLGRPGLLSLFVSGAAAKALLRALRAGFMQGPVRGDALQLGGALVVARDGRILFRHAAEHAGDHPDVAGLVRATERARAA